MLPKRKPGPRQKYPEIACLKPGQSIFIPHSHYETPKKARQAVRFMAWRYAHKTGKNLVTRSNQEGISVIFEKEVRK